jgi:hypothetical protein
LDPSDHRVSKTIRKNCPARVIVRLNRDGLYRLTTVCLDHNHATLADDELPPYFGPSNEQKALVQDLSLARNLTRRDVRTLLTARFLDRPLTLSQVSNLMDAAKRSRRNHVEDLGGDMVATVTRLLEMKEADSRWVVHVEVDAKTNRFSRLFWMSPNMIDIGRRNSDVIVNDITLMRNQYNVPLNIWVVIDHQFKTRNIAYALQTSETIEDHQWAIDHLFAVIQPPPDGAYFSDADQAISSVLKTRGVWHGLCLHHLSGNITKNLAPVLGALFQSFLTSFWHTYYSISPEVFETRWNRLLDDFPRCRNYLGRVLYPTRERWAWAWVATRFTCAVRTSGRVESENRVNKLFGNTKTSFSDLTKALISRADDQVASERLETIKVGCIPHTRICDWC